MKPDSFTPARHWLERFGDTNKIERLNPFEVQADGKPWTVATDSTMMVWVPGSLGFPPYAGYADAFVVETAIRFIRSRPVKMEAIQTEVLRAACGDPVFAEKFATTIQCPKCKGKKVVPHDCGCELCEADKEPCDTCEETGTIEEITDPSSPINPRRYGHEVIDANYLAFLIRYAPVEPQIELAAYQGHFYVRSGDIRAVIAPMTFRHQVPALLPTA